MDGGHLYEWTLNIPFFDWVESVRLDSFVLLVVSQHMLTIFVFDYCFHILKSGINYTKCIRQEQYCVSSWFSRTHMSFVPHSVVDQRYCKTTQKYRVTLLPLAHTTYRNVKINKTKFVLNNSQSRISLL